MFKSPPDFIADPFSASARERLFMMASFGDIPELRPQTQHEIACLMQPTMEEDIRKLVRDLKDEPRHKTQNALLQQFCMSRANQESGSGILQTYISARVIHARSLSLYTRRLLVRKGHIWTWQVAVDNNLESHIPACCFTATRIWLRNQGIPTGLVIKHEGLRNWLKDNY